MTKKLKTLSWSFFVVGLCLVIYSHMDTTWPYGEEYGGTLCMDGQSGAVWANDDDCPEGTEDITQLYAPFFQSYETDSGVEMSIDESAYHPGLGWFCCTDDENGYECHRYDLPACPKGTFEHDGRYDHIWDDLGWPMLSTPIGIEERLEALERKIEALEELCKGGTIER